MNDLDGLLARVISDLKGLGIPVSDRIDPHVVINRRAVTRFGCCAQRDGGFQIEVAVSLLEAEERACLHVLTHEALHTCPGCRDHGRLWRSYAARVNQAFGYGIQRTTSAASLGLPDLRQVRYRVVCSKCGAEFKRTKLCPLVEHPERYRCRCGGILVRKD